MSLAGIVRKATMKSWSWSNWPTAGSLLGVYRQSLSQRDTEIAITSKARMVRLVKKEKKAWSW